MLKQLVYAIPSLFLFLLSASTSQADEITANMLKADTRLQIRVTIRSPHILIGELLERLSKQSGVTLAADDWSTVGSDSVTVSLHDVPLADTMNALWSLFSYQHVEWNWQRRPVKGSPGEYTYTLARPDYARFLAERLQEQVQTDFEAQAQELFDALNMTPDQIKEGAKHDDLLKSFKDDGRVGPGMRILASLPPETLLNLLRNNQGISMPISELPPDAQKAVQDARDWEIASAAKQNITASALGKVSDHIAIYTFTEPGFVAPAVGIDTGWGTGEYFGGAYIQDAWQEKMNAQWMQPGDSVDNLASVRTLAPPKQEPPAVNPSHPLADYLLHFADAAQVPLLARIPHSLDIGTQDMTLSQIPVSKTVTTFLAQAQQQPLLIDHKWRGGILLLTCQNWFIGQSEDARLPWSEVKWLRDIEATSDTFLSLGDIAHAANVLNDAQMSALGEWFPVMTTAAPWHDFLAFYDKTPEYRPRVLSAKGDDYQYPESLVNSQLGIDALRMTHPNLRLQIKQSQNPECKLPTHQVLVVVLDDDGIHRLNGRGFGYQAQEYQTSLQVDETMPLTSGNKSSSAK